MQTAFDLHLSRPPAEPAHRCEFCGARATKLTPATERQARAARALDVGALLCPTDAANLTADADARDEMVLDAEVAKADADVSPLPWERTWTPGRAA